MQKHGQKTLAQYASLYIDVNLNPPIHRRQDELISTIRDDVAGRFGQTVGQQVAKQLERYYFVSTSDHHGPIVDFSFSNANLLAAVSHATHQDPDLAYIIVLACSSISFRNISFPRGLVYHVVQDGKSDIERVSFFPASARSCPVFNFRPYTRTEIEQVKTNLGKKQYNPMIKEKLAALLDEVYLQPEVLTCRSFTDQVTLTNAAVWRRFFLSPLQPPAELLSLEQETIVTQLILRYHLDQDTTIYHVLFDPDYESLLKQYFDGIMGAFSTADHSGSYLFWALPPGSKYRQQLWKHGAVLSTDDGQYSVAMTPAAIRGALERKEIFPTTLLDFFVLSFYYGLKCLGGFNQINYLTAMKGAYIKMNVDRMNYRSIEVCARAQTKEMSDGYLIAYGQAPDGGVVQANGIDMYLYGDAQTWGIVQEVANTVTINDSLYPAMPEFYRYVYTEVQRDPKLAAITPEQVIFHHGLQDKLKPCVRYA
ncbi:MAG: hypothetical protein ACD_41C00133G0003 [uncultured bacterium]|nr:MAG: hypothetical protein ACD_41C00133G0003 [uncultured bacterium]